MDVLYKAENFKMIIVFLYLLLSVFIGVVSSFGLGLLLTIILIILIYNITRLTSYEQFFLNIITYGTFLLSYLFYDILNYQGGVGITLLVVGTYLVFYRVIFKSYENGFKIIHVLKNILPFIIYAMILILSYKIYGIKSNEYALSKLKNYIFVTIPTIFVVAYLLNTRELIKKYYFSIVLVGGVCSVISNVQYLISSFEGRFSFIFNNPIWFGRAMGIEALICIWYLTKEKKYKILTLGLLISSLVSLIISGSRAPFMLFFFSAIYYMFNKRLRKRDIFIIVLVGLVLITIFILLSNSLLFDRIFQLFSSEKDDSTMTRIYLLEISKSIFEANPVFGIGIGNFYTLNILASGGLIYLYPHNILMEILIETGLIGFLLWFFFFIYIIFIVLRLRQYNDDSGLNKISISIWLYCILNAQVSGDINGNTLLLVYSVILTNLYSNKGMSLNVIKKSTGAYLQNESST